MRSWLTRFWKKPREIGSVAPSSPMLGALMAKHIAPTSRVVEIGPGEGAITEALVKRLADPARLCLVEIDPDLAAECRKKFPSVEIHVDDAEHFLGKMDGAVDNVVSGVPFGIMEKDKRIRMFKLVHERLVTGGTFILFQYSLVRQAEIEQVFGPVKIEFMPWNIPPAFVFVATKK